MKTSMWRLVLAYDGTPFHGWQIQTSCITVQGELRKALFRVTGEDVLPQGSGRTDTGVHALGQVASCALAAPIPPANLVRALNRTLPPALRVLSAHREPDGFHARRSAHAKTYEYRIFRGAICAPWQAPYVYAYPSRLNLEAMHQAAALVCGEHDFRAFAATDPDLRQRSTPQTDLPPSARDKRGCIRTLSHSQWLHDEESQSLVYRVTGNGFLHHMVRNLVGTFLEVGRGNLAATEMLSILQSRARGLAGPTAPARGLFLVSVEYGDPSAAPQ